MIQSSELDRAAELGQASDLHVAEGHSVEQPDNLPLSGKQLSSPRDETSASQPSHQNTAGCGIVPSSNIQMQIGALQC
ncbi:hypothetical protein VTK73DRAFT_2515 [Phialemonium thermophilum]|uniref:Uncharacterized protein n=1 Tax=Phialemonium thermophilum TaxID=223376 RepID=A0ABR3X505_9PEZI